MLSDSFGSPDDVERYKTSSAIFNAKMRDGASVTDHVLYMIELMERLGKLDFFLHEQLGKDAILNLMSKTYLPFLTYYRITKAEVNYHGLLRLLQNFEKDHQLHNELVNLVKGSSSSSRLFKKKRRTRRRSSKRCKFRLGHLCRARPRR